MIAVNLVKARAIWRDKMRAARAPLLADLDIQYQKADELGAAAVKAQIAQAKQRLRDAPSDPAIEAAETLEQLIAVWPAELGDRPN